MIQTFILDPTDCVNYPEFVKSIIHFDKEMNIQEWIPGLLLIFMNNDDKHDIPA